MIILITGVPGAGKTLYGLNLVKARAEKETRTVYQNGIANLILPWEVLDDGEKWFTCPDGAMIVIDEAQRVFRPRGTGSAVPDYVAKLETHRHHGHDVVLITQHPMLIDSNIRRLVGQHFHVVRRFGMQNAVVHEWSSCTEISKASIMESVRHEFRYPAESFGWYKSAEVHTHKRRIPMRMFFLALSPFVIAGLVWFSYTKLGVYLDGRKAAEVAAKNVKLPDGPQHIPGVVDGPGVGVSALSALDYARARVPRVLGLAYTAPVYDKVTDVQRAPVPVGCVASPARCGCYSQDGTRLPMDEEMCRSIVENGFFVPFQVGNGGGGSNSGPVSDLKSGGGGVARPENDVSAFRRTGGLPPVGGQGTAGGVGGVPSTLQNSGGPSGAESARGGVKASSGS